MSMCEIPLWDFFELSCRNDAAGNPFDVDFGAVFAQGKDTVRVRGFYDGEGVWRVRFMPEREGEWHYVTYSSLAALAGESGSIHCVAPEPGNKGPVRAAVGNRGFDHADGSPFFVLGTTAYAWTYRPEEVRARTLESFSKYGFNKIRMCVFPKTYGDGKEIDISYEPVLYPFAGKPGAFDFSRPNPGFFRDYEDRLAELRFRGIVADVILFHPYDDRRWGIPQGMTADDDLKYVDYVVARFGAFRNVWWSLANEYDLFSKDWDAIGSRLAAVDPYDHPRSIHNWAWGPVYPDRPWLTHVSYQHPNTFSRLLDLRASYSKPVVNDEYQYEGDVSTDWGNCTPETELRRHWMAVMAGGYGTHGEVRRVGESRKDYFWSYGGTLQGGSPPRLRFMKDLMESLSWRELDVYWEQTDGRDIFCMNKADDLYLYFITPEFKDRRRFWIGGYPIDERIRYSVSIHDIWECKKVRDVTIPRTGSGGLLGDLPAWTVLVVRKEK